jgi:hypothetical protein
VAVDEGKIAKALLRDHGAHPLDQCIAAVVERCGIHDSGALGCGGQLKALARRDCQRLVGNDVLACRDGCHADGKVQVIGRGVVDDMDRRIGNQFFIGAVGPVHSELGRFARCPLKRRAGDTDDLDIAQPPHRIEVMRSHEAGTCQAHADPACS